MEREKTLAVFIRTIVSPVIVLYHYSSVERLNTA